MTLREFADLQRLKVSRDDCGDPAVKGKLGDLYEYSDAELGMCFTPPETKEEPWGKWMPRKWGNIRRACIAAGMTLRQNGDSEGCLSFNPANPTQAKLAIKSIAARPKRHLSPEQLARLRIIGFSGSRPTVERTLAA